MGPDDTPETPDNTAAPPLWLLVITGLVLGVALVALLVTGTSPVVWITVLAVLATIGILALVRWFQSWR